MENPHIRRPVNWLRCYYKPEHTRFSEIAVAFVCVLTTLVPPRVLIVIVSLSRISGFYLQPESGRRALPIEGVFGAPPVSTRWVARELLVS